MNARQRCIALNRAVELVEFLATSYYGWWVVLIETVDEYPVVGKQCCNGFALAARNPGQTEAIATARRRLCDENQMGRLFKVIGLRHPDWPAIAGLEP